MKKATISLAACLLIASSAFADQKTDGGSIVIAGGLLDCSGAISVTCGEVASGTSAGLGNVLNYGCTTLSYPDCGETVYEVCLGATDDLNVTVTYNHLSGATDLDAFLLGSCNEADCLDSSTATSGVENLQLLGAAAGTYYVVVDGWNGLCADPTNTIDVSCSSPCTPVSVDVKDWGNVKGLYR